jgi:transcriptional regulator with XRE-family HTH domain
MARNHPTPIAVARAARQIGTDIAVWRKLRGLTSAQVADRAGISRETISRLEGGAGTVSLENVLRVARALGIMDGVVGTFDPYASDVGRLRADQSLPQRVRHRRPDSGRE